MIHISAELKITNCYFHFFYSALSSLTAKAEHFADLDQTRLVCDHQPWHWNGFVYGVHMDVVETLGVLFSL